VPNHITAGLRKQRIKPPKPYPTFPLSPHASGKWRKRIRGSFHYFGRWGVRVNGRLERLPGDGWKEALELYQAQADALHAGRKPVVHTGDHLADPRHRCTRNEWNYTCRFI
jgi:hypothetical protein